MSATRSPSSWHGRASRRGRDLLPWAASAFRQEFRVSHQSWTRPMNLAAITRIAAAALGAIAASAAAAEAGVSGSGASFPAKVYSQWAEQYAKERGVTVQYQASGSSAGVRQIKARAVDFGATDVPLSTAELEK